MRAASGWQFICTVEDIFPETGVCALIDGQQIAIFRLGEQIFAIDNFDPISGANVLSRGIPGDLQGEIVIASPIYKHHFSLITGKCLEDPDKSVRCYQVQVSDGRVWVKSGRQPAAKRRLVVIGNGMAGMRVVEE